MADKGDRQPARSMFVRAKHAAFLRVDAKKREQIRGCDLTLEPLGLTGACQCEVAKWAAAIPSKECA
jgi:hypothetical protein